MTGGFVPPPDDGIPVRASKGEFLMSAAAVDYYGRGLMDAMNERREQKDASLAVIEASVSEYLAAMDELIASAEAWLRRKPWLVRFLARWLAFFR